jgi:hypothetical protein
MATVGTARTRPPRRRQATDPAAGAADRDDASSPRSPAFIGLCTIVMAVPLLVLAEATGPYDDPKAWAFPILVTLTLLAWIAGARSPVSLDGPAGDRPVRILRWLIVASLGWWVIATVTSIAPMQSVVGTFGRGMGLLTIGSAALLFFVVQSECRTPTAIRALVDTMLLGSAPVCLFALGQAIGWDPLPRSWDPAVATLKVRSTFGQHIFLGSYLVLLVPLAAGRLHWELGRWRSAPADDRRRTTPVRSVGSGALWMTGAIGLIALTSRWPDGWWLLLPWGALGALAWVVARHADRQRSRQAVTVAMLLALLTAQLTVVVLSRARGALLGMLVGLAVAGFTLYARRRAWKMLAVIVAVVGAVFVMLVLLNIKPSPLGPLAKVGVLSRFSQLTDVRRGTPVWFRLEVWHDIVTGWTRQVMGEEVVPGTRPWFRSAFGYGFETQLLTLDPLSRSTLGNLGARGPGWRAEYLVDRAHNALLDQLATTGLIGAALWLALGGALLAVGVWRVRRSAAGEETVLRLGMLGALIGHAAEGQVGIATTVPLALLWMTAGLLASPPWSAERRHVAASSPPTPRRRWRAVLLVSVALSAVLVAWLNTRWLLASIAYAEGTRRYIAGQPAEAYANFARSTTLAPWIPLPAEAFAYTALRRGGGEPNPARRLEILQQGASTLAEARRYARGGASSWTLTGQIAFAEVKAGERGKLAESLQAFEMAALLRARDPDIMAQWAWAWLEAGEPARARATAERAVSLSDHHWLGSAVLARAAHELGDGAEAARAAETARRFAPPGAHRLLEGLLP